MRSIVVGDDGRARCAWAGSDAEYQRYHDEEWGTPLHGDRPLFEKLSLEGFQAGLSWITILRRRPTFRAAFARIRHRRRRRVRRARRRAADGRSRHHPQPRQGRGDDLERPRHAGSWSPGAPGALDALLWGFAPPPRSCAPASFAELPAVTPESTAASKALKKLGYRFVGPTTIYALMQSAGMVDDHVAGCWRARA